MRLRMSRALRTARLADLRAQTTELHRIPAVARHVRSRHAAYRRAVQVEANALDHHLDVVLPQTRARAVVAGIGAEVAGLDARLVALLTHVVLLDVQEVSCQSFCADLCVTMG